MLRQQNVSRASPEVLNEVSANRDSLKLTYGEEEHSVKLAGDWLKRKSKFSFISLFILK